MTASCPAEPDARVEQGVGHVGDGTFHLVYIRDPEDPGEIAEAERFNARFIGDEGAAEFEENCCHGDVKRDSVAQEDLRLRITQ